MMTFGRKVSWSAAGAALVLSMSTVRGASLYLSAVAETFGSNAGAFAAGPGKPVTYTAIDGGYIEAGDPMGGIKPAPAPLIESALAQALAQRGFQPAPGGTSPALLFVYNWGEIRRDSHQIQPASHLKGNDRARLLLMAPTRQAKRIEEDIVDDRYSHLKVGHMTRTASDQDAIDLAHDDLYFVVISAYDVAALQQHVQTPLWQVRLATRAVGHSMSDALVSLIHYGAPYFGTNEAERQDLHEPVVPASSVGIQATIPALNVVPAGVDPAFVQSIVQSEHARWSGEFRD